MGKADRKKYNPLLGRRKISKEEAMKRVLRQEIYAEIRTDGKTRDEVRRLLDALPPWTPFVDVTDQLSSPLARQMGIDDPNVLLKMQELLGTGNSGTRAFQNSRYFVHRTPTSGGGFTLSIRTLQNDARHDWREFQRIKNELCGEDREAVELYPAETRLVDTSNQYYVHVLPAGLMVPVGFETRLVMKPRPEGDPSGTNQRPWEPGSQPADAQDAPSANLDKLVYRKAIEALTKERDSGGSDQEDPEPEGDRVVRAPGAADPGEGLHRGGHEDAGGQSDQRRQAGEGAGAGGEDHQQVPAAAGGDDHQVRDARPEEGEEGFREGAD